MAPAMRLRVGLGKPRNANHAKPKWNGVDDPLPQRVNATTQLFFVSRIRRSPRFEVNGEHPTSNIQHPTSNIEHRTSNIQHRTSNNLRPAVSTRVYLRSSAFICG